MARAIVLQVVLKQRPLPLRGSALALPIAGGQRIVARRQPLRPDMRFEGVEMQAGRGQGAKRGSRPCRSGW